MDAKVATSMPGLPTGGTLIPTVLVINGRQSMVHHRPDCQFDKPYRARCGNPPSFFKYAMAGFDNTVPTPLILYYRYQNQNWDHHNSSFRKPKILNTDAWMTALYKIGRSLCFMGAERFQDPDCIAWNAAEEKANPRRRTAK